MLIIKGINKFNKKIKERGFCGLCSTATYKLSYRFFSLFPIKENRIVFESDGDLCDNAYAFFEYLTGLNEFKKYDIAWLVYDPLKAKQQVQMKVHFISKEYHRGGIKRAFYLSTSKYYIYDHINYLSDTKRKGQIIVYLSHGCGFKAVEPKEGYVSNIDRCYVTGKLYIPMLAHSQACPIEVVKDLGYPRLDYFFKPISEAQKQFASRYRFDEYNKILLWMPTFRKSKKEDLNEDYFDSLTGLPLLEQEEQLHDFDHFLKKNRCFCLLKIHHLQAELPAFKNGFENIIVLKDEAIAENGLQLYQVICLTNILITDYSSVSNDYLLLDRPIIYTLDDYEKYRESRGFKIDDPIRYYIGHHAYNPNDLQNSIVDILCNGDIYREERNSVLDELHSYTDGHASQRIKEDLRL